MTNVIVRRNGRENPVMSTNLPLLSSTIEEIAIVDHCNLMALPVPCSIEAADKPPPEIS